MALSSTYLKKKKKKIRVVQGSTVIPPPKEKAGLRESTPLHICSASLRNQGSVSGRRDLEGCRPWQSVAGGLLTHVAGLSLSSQVTLYWNMDLDSHPRKQDSLVHLSHPSPPADWTKTGTRLWAQLVSKHKKQNFINTTSISFEVWRHNVKMCLLFWYLELRIAFPY